MAIQIETEDAEVAFAVERWFHARDGDRVRNRTSDFSCSITCHREFLELTAQSDSPLHRRTDLTMKMPE